MGKAKYNAEKCQRQYWYEDSLVRNVCRSWVQGNRAISGPIISIQKVRNTTCHHPFFNLLFALLTAQRHKIHHILIL